MSDDYFEISILFDRFLRKFFLQLHSEMKDVDLPVTLQDMKLLLFVDDHPNIAISKLVDFTRIDKSQITRKVREFESKGLLVRTPSEDDQRVSIISLTSQGSLTAREMKAVGLQVLNDILSPLTEDEKAGLAGILKRVL